MTPSFLISPVRGWRLITPRVGSVLADIALVAFLVVFGAITQPGFGVASGSQLAYSVMVFGVSAAMLLRRRRPRVALTVIGGLLVAHLFLVEGPTLFAAVVCLIAVYTTQARLESPWRWGFLAAAYLGAGIAVWLLPRVEGGHRGLDVATLAGALTIAALAGVVRRDARARYEQALERVTILEREQASERRLAAAEERTRIAREMHDILGHSLTTVAVQAEGARYALPTDPDRVDQMLADIAQLSRQTVDDVRHLVDVLRAGDPASTRPDPTLRDVPELIGTFTNASAIRLHQSGDLEEVPAQVGMAAYRIIQESLTNAARYAPEGAVEVELAATGSSLDLVIVNGRPSAPISAPMSGQGHGVTGMGERARALGGGLYAGPVPDAGGWRVIAYLPYLRS